MNRSNGLCEAAGKQESGKSEPDRLMIYRLALIILNIVESISLCAAYFTSFTVAGFANSLSGILSLLVIESKLTRALCFPSL